MDRAERESFFRDLAEKFQEINGIFDEYGIDGPNNDCEEEDCTIPDDHDILVLHKTLREGNIILEDYMT